MTSDNNMTYETWDHFYTQTEFVTISTVWSLITLTGIFGNGIVIYTLVRYGKQSVTNLYITNLAVADLSFILCTVPATWIFHYFSWIFGNILCKISNYMIYVTLHATCLILSTMTADRYQVIVNPFEAMKWRSKFATSIIIIGVWTVSFLISLPALYYYTVVENNNENILMCVLPSMSLDKWLTFGSVCTSFVIPVSIISVSYGRILFHVWDCHILIHQGDKKNNNGITMKKITKRIKRVTQMVAILVLVFFACWLPIHLLMLLSRFVENFQNKGNIESIKIFGLFGNTLSFINSCINPFIYAFVHDDFQKSLRRHSSRLHKETR